jgi:hypothetical protein
MSGSFFGPCFDRRRRGNADTTHSRAYVECNELQTFAEPHADSRQWEDMAGDFDRSLAIKGETIGEEGDEDEFRANQDTLQDGCHSYVVPLRFLLFSHLASM